MKRDDMIKSRYWIGILLVVILGSIVFMGRYRGSEEVYTSVNEDDIYGKLSTADGSQAFYVAPYGDDAGPGTLDLPWRTIQHASDTLEPGDTVYIRGGVYEENVELSRGGSHESYITYAAYPGETPILDGKSVDWDDAFSLADESYIKIDGLEIQNWNGFGVVSWGHSDHVVVNNVEIHNCDTAIRLFDNHDDWLLENSYLHHNSLIGVDCSPGPCTNILIRNIRSIHNGVEGDTASDGFAFESGNDILVEDCEASHNGGDGFDFKSDGTHLARVLARDNARNNIKLWGENSSLINALSYDSGLTNLVLDEGGSFRVINSLIANQKSYGYLAVLGGYETSTSTPVVLYNNIFYNDNSAMGGTTLYYSMGTMLTADNNIYWNPYRTDDVICAGFVDDCFSSDDINDGTWSAASGADSNSTYVDPLFVDAESKDFHLTAESPAVDTGNSDVAPNIDLEGTSRPQGSCVDIGPYEKRVIGSSSLDLEDFPHPFVDEAGNLQATFIYGQSEEHGPSHGAWTIDVAGGTLVASTLGRESMYGFPRALIDIEASTFDQNQVAGVTAFGNLITIGGGDVNLVSRHYMFLEVNGQYAMPVVDIFNGDGWTVGIYSRHSGTSYYRQGSYGQGTPVIDYALASLYKDENRYILYVAGITGFTTRGMCGVLADYQNYGLSGATVIIRFLDDDGDGTFEGIDTIESIPSAVTFDKMALWDLSSGPHLRGANIYQRRVYPELDGPGFMGLGPVGPPYIQEDFDRLAELGANLVVVSHPGLFTENPPYTLDQEIQNYLDDLLDMIAKADMFAVINFRTVPGRSEFTFMLDEVGDWFDESYLNDEVWRDQAAQETWVDMWRYTAERYSDNPVVVGYNLMVEPNANEVWLGIWDPEEFYDGYGGTLYDWNQLFPRITAAIREVDIETPILIGGMSYSAVEWLPYIETTDDPQSIYTTHQYAPVSYTHQWRGSQECTYPGACDTDWDGTEDPFDRTWLENLLSTVDIFVTTYDVPVAVDEFGVMRWEPGAAEFMGDQMDLFEQRGLNYALWMWDPSWEPWTEKVDAFNFRHGPDPENHADIVSSDLIDVIVEYWGLNAIRPSTV